MKLGMKCQLGIVFLFFSLNSFATSLCDNTGINFQVSQYINNHWDTLTRDIFYQYQSSSDHPIIYIANDEDIHQIKAEISKHFSKNITYKLDIRYLPSNTNEIKQHGLLYLPNPYVVPGGRFNEMFGWDSYFIALGLLENNRLVLTKNIIDNLIYEINHYGTILNANGTEYLKRSHPPLLTSMILEYFNKTHDIPWLTSTLPAINKLYNFWTTPPHLIPTIGLSRYYAGGDGPAPEEDSNYYKKVLSYYRTHSIDDYNKNDFYDEKHNKLKNLFYTADRTIRESGFDITNKYGPFGAAIIDYAPVDLNVLLYQMEKDMGQIYQLLGDVNTSSIWLTRAKRRAALINHYMWNDNLGYYFDYNFKTQKQRPYIYVTTFYPLWAGIASKKQAEKIVNNLPQLLAKGGVLTSTYHAKFQWDAPFGWAPMQYFTVMGLKKYGYHDIANDIANRFIQTVNRNFDKHHLLFEKYDVLNLSVDTKNKISYGYATNEVGFGWTNGVYMKFLKFLNNTA